MCGGSPQAPDIVYSGPSQSDINRNNQALAAYQGQMEQQQTAFQSQLQTQIDKANQETADLQKRYEALMRFAGPGVGERADELGLDTLRCEQVVEQIEIQSKYAGYIARQRDDERRAEPAVEHREPAP